MIVIWIMSILLYLILNSIIAISWFVDNHYERKSSAIIVAIMLVLFGLPMMVIAVTVAIAITIIRRIRKDER